MSCPISELMNDRVRPTTRTLSSEILVFPAFFANFQVEARDGELQWVAALCSKGAGVSHHLSFSLSCKSLSSNRDGNRNSGGAKQECCFYASMHHAHRCEELAHIVGLGGKTWARNWRTGQLAEETQDKVRKGWGRGASSVSWKVHSFVPDKE